MRAISGVIRPLHRAQVNRRREASVFTDYW
jgi:hypothetical protein